jgi:hyperosmotically inducible periplasmic protein
VKVFLALVVGIVFGAAAIWFFATKEGQSTLRATGEQIESATKPARDAIQEQIAGFKLDPQEIKDELAKTGQVVRRKAQQAGQSIADATADARTTTAIKARLVTDKSLSALDISVNTTDGVVTLSGAVATTADIGKAMVLAMEADGVREVISTLQVKPKNLAGKPKN